MNKTILFVDALFLVSILLLVIILISETDIGRVYLFDDKVGINVLIIFSIIVYANIQLMRWIKRGLFKGFEEVKDLVRGTIVAEVD